MAHDIGWSPAEAEAIEAEKRMEAMEALVVVLPVVERSRIV